MARMKEDLQRFLRDAHILARLVEHVLEEGYLREATSDPVTFDQLNILKFLARPTRSLIKDVARFLNASYAAASKAVSRLTKKKLVRAVTWGEDRRAELLTVTAKGRALIAQYEKTKAQRLLELMRGENVGEIAAGLEKAIGVLIRERVVAGNPCLGCGAYYSRDCMVRAHGFACGCHTDGVPQARKRAGRR